jgi:hypothetical protein
VFGTYHGASAIMRRLLRLEALQDLDVGCGSRAQSWIPYSDRLEDGFI